MSTVLKNRCVVITGGGRGLGAAIAAAVSAAGARVIVADIRHEIAASTAASLRNAAALQLDVTDEQQVATALDEIAEREGGIDAVVNNAGIDITQSLAEVAPADWKRVVDVNLHGPFLVAKYALPYLRQSRGSLVNISSTAACRAWPNASAYHASKWGLMGLSHALHAELRDQGIKVTAVVAGGMRTPFLLDRFPDLDPGLLQDPANVAAAVVFALSMPAESVIPEIMVLPMKETSWP